MSPGCRGPNEQQIFVNLPVADIERSQKFLRRPRVHVQREALATGEPFALVQPAEATPADPPPLQARRFSKFSRPCTGLSAGRVNDKGMAEQRPPPAGQPGYGPPPGTPTSTGAGLGRVRLRNPQSTVLIAVIAIALVAAGLLASELYARHRAESVVEAAIECVVHDKASVSFGATPLLLQLATDHYRNISIHTAGNRLGNARGMKADVLLDDVQLDGDATGTVGALDAAITWSADGMRQSIQDAITPLRGLVTEVQTNPDGGTIKLQGNVGSVTTKPQITDGRVALQVVDVTGLGLLLPSETMQSALDAFTTHLTENYPLDIHADSVQITDNGVTAHYSSRDTAIPHGNQGNQGNKNNQHPCFAGL